MGFRYNYSPSSSNGLKERIKSIIDAISSGKLPTQTGDAAKKVTIVGSVIILFGLVVLLGNSYSGLAVSKINVEAEFDNTKDVLENTLKTKSECESSLLNTIDKVGACESKLSDTAGNLVSCESKRNELEKYSDELNLFYTTCLDEKKEVESNYDTALDEMEDMKADYDNLVRNSVRSACCSVNDIIGGFVRNWEASENKIVCSESGEFTVDCGTGETDF